MASYVYLEGGMQRYPQRLEATPESLEIIEHRDCTVMYRDIRDRQEAVLLERGYMVSRYHPYKYLGDIDTLNWHEVRNSEAWYARLCKAVEELLGKSEVIIVVH